MMEPTCRECGGPPLELNRWGICGPCEARGVEEMRVQIQAVDKLPLEDQRIYKTAWALGIRLPDPPLVVA
jgi:hypothetical protein